ncbi:autotransporter outer membrane beta-barrel domain-containing protein [Bartonella sp. B39]
MVTNVFYKHAFLYNFTTAILYFLQVTYVSAAGSSSDAGETFYKCDDRKTHFLADKVYYLKNSQEAAPIAAIYVEKSGTVIDASQITVMGDNPKTITTYGGYAKDGGKLVLTDSNFNNIPALRAQDAVISMTNGSIKGSSHAIYASGKKTDVALVTVNIDIEPDNLGIKGIGILSGFGAQVRTAGGNVTFNGIGSFSTRFGGRYIIDTMTIKGEGKRENSVASNRDTSTLPEAFEVFQGGSVHLKSSSVQLTDMHGFLIKNFSFYADFNADENRLFLKRGFSDHFVDTSIKIERSNISVQGEGAHGLYFHALTLDDTVSMLNQDGIKLSGKERVVLGKASVHLKNTTFTVADGIAIYSTGSNGYGSEGTLELSEETKISGDLLLKAENNSSLFVKAAASSLTGDARVEDISSAGLELTRGSTWYLTKSKYNKGLQGADSTDSSISYVSLSDSTIVFNKYLSSGYQTLRIGKKTDIAEEGKILYGLADQKAYTAVGNVQIKLSAFLNDDGLFDPQQTDRILIYGDVSGRTLIHMQNFLKTSHKEVRGGKDQSISLIQVSGTAQEDSFKLADDYTTVNGFPYQYRLRGYGPGSSFGKADSGNRLVEGEGDFWDFRLEGVYIKSEAESSETIPITPISIPFVLLEPGDLSSSEPSAPVDPSLYSSVPITPTSISSVPSDQSNPIPTDSSPTPSTSVTPTPSPSAPSDSSNPIPTDSVPTPPSTSVTPTPSPSAPSDPSDPTPTDPTSTPPSTSVTPTYTYSELSDPSDSIPTDPLPSPTPSVPVNPDVQNEPRIKAVVPQVPTYLLLPNALFHAGLMDLTTQNRKLETMRSASIGSLKGGENTAFFIRGYGGSHHYASNLSASEYGYGAELDYSALEAGVLLKEIESSYSRTFFGVTGTYGNLSLHPLNVEQSKKSPFDKWSVAAYGSLQHDAGFYMDGLLSYGLFRGDIFTLARGKTATLKGKQFNASMTSGKTFTVGHKGFVFDPQVQLIYQHLQFGGMRDIDGLDIDMGKFNQWTARAGGRLTKFLALFEEGRVISFYGKLYLMRSFGDRQFVSFKNDFQLGDFGSSLEVGLGFNAKLSSKFVLHGDINYQHRLTKAGFSGASFSAGLRHLF